MEEFGAHFAVLGLIGDFGSNLEEFEFNLEDLGFNLGDLGVNLGDFGVYLGASGSILGGNSADFGRYWGELGRIWGGPALPQLPPWRGRGFWGEKGLFWGRFQGVSLLGLRAAAMLHYVTDLALLLRSKSGGRSLREEPALPRLLESRVVIGRERGGGRGLGGRAVGDWGGWESGRGLGWVV